MEHKKILSDCGFGDSELVGGTLSVTTPIDGSEIASIENAFNNRYGFNDSKG